MQRLSSVTPSVTPEVENQRAVLNALLRAVRDMPLDPVGVVEVALDAMGALGFPAAAVFALDQEGGNPKQIAERGDAFHPDEAVAAVIGSGTPIVMGRVIASPAWVDGWLSAVLVGRRAAYRPAGPDDVSAIGLLAAATGVGLQNAQRFELERQTIERLEQLDRLKNDFLSTVSHELRTPLTAIQGMGQTLERSWHELDEATRCEFLRSINLRVAALGEMVAELLEVSELDAGNGRLQSETVELSNLLERTLTWVPVVLGARELRMDVASDLHVKGDAKLLGRVIDQLLSNVAKHTPEGTTVTVSAFGDGATVTVSIADDGPGLAPEDLVRVGDRFHRGGTLNERVSGLGLGLALAHEILTLHGSRLEVQSEPGYGARFWFVLGNDG